MFLLRCNVGMIVFIWDGSHLFVTSDKDAAIVTSGNRSDLLRRRILLEIQLFQMKHILV